MTGRLLIYGENGYTGELTARFAAEREQQAIVAGRSAERVRAVADRYGFEHRGFGLDDPQALLGAWSASESSCIAPGHSAARPSR